MNLSEDEYLTINHSSEGDFKDKGSKFLAYAFHVTSESEIKSRLEHLKKQHPSARHFCYAFRINPENEYWRANDDGEPSSSAGKPILGQIRSNHIHEILIVVVRYFGGTLLGVPGLINAYKSAAYEAIKNAKIEKRIIKRSFILKAGYEQIGELMKFIKDHQLEYEAPRMNEQVEIHIRIPKSEADKMKDIFVEKRWISESDL